jgi:hypothetical protein
LVLNFIKELEKEINHKYVQKFQNSNAFFTNQDFPFDDCIDINGFCNTSFDFYYPI